MAGRGVLSQVIARASCAALFVSAVACLGVDRAPSAPAPSLPAPPPPAASATSDDASFERVSAPKAGLFSLTASDGTGLSLVGYRSRTILEEPLALTEIELTFENPEARTIEGHFEVRLPPRAALARFAMLVDDAWQEAEVVETTLARDAYESFLQRRRDPALVEQAAANVFGARVFPIAPKSQKHLRIAYSEVLDDLGPFRLPLRGLDAVTSFSAEVRTAGVARPVASLAGEAPRADLLVPRPDAAKAIGRVAGDHVVVRVPLGAATPTAPSLDADATWLFLVDASASRALDWAATNDDVRAEIGELAPDTPVVVAAFDQSVEPIFDGTAAAFAGAPSSALERRGPLGASDVGRALGWARERVAARGKRARVVLVGDAVASAGVTEPSDLALAARSLGQAGVVRVDAIARGGLRDDANLAAIVAGGSAGAGVVADTALGIDEVARRLREPTLPARAIAIDGARWVTPSTVDGRSRGDLVTVYAEIPRAGDHVEVRVGDARVLVPLARSEAALVERASAGARIATLEAEPPTEATRAAIVEISKRLRVPSRYTSMLVLETDADYARFGIDRRAPSSILVPRDDGHVVVERSPRWPRRGAETPSPAFPQPFVASSPAMSASPASASPVSPMAAPSPAAPGARVAAPGARVAAPRAPASSHFGRVVTSHAVRVPQVRMGATVVTGRVPPESVQRVVRRGFGRLRGCYAEHFPGTHRFEGRVEMSFVIASSGEVTRAAIQSSESRNQAFLDCLVGAFRSLRFPANDSGVVHVRYPIVFGHADDAEHAPQRGPALARGLPPEPPKDVEPWRGTTPYAGSFAKVMSELSAGDAEGALADARAWAGRSSDDALAFVALGEAAEATGHRALAARAYGSLVDLWPYRADMLRFAGERLDRLNDPAALDLAIDAYEKAVRDRPDHPGGHRLLAYALARRGDAGGAFRAILSGLGRVHDARYRGVEDILRGDVAVLAAAYEAREPWHGAEIAAKLEAVGVTIERRPSARFVLSWETDANDVDLHVWDGDEHHAYYGAPRLPGGGSLVADVTTGYGPEALVVPLDAPGARGTYRLGVHYYARGPMGFGMGKLEIVEHDGHGKLLFDERPYVVMTNHSGLDLGTYTPKMPPLRGVTAGL